MFITIGIFEGKIMMMPQVFSDMVQAWHNFHFLRPYMFVLLLPLVWLVYQSRKQEGGLGAWQRLVQPELLAYLKVGKSSKGSRLIAGVSILTVLLMLLALAGPVWEKLPQPVYHKQSALVVVLDLSKSMDAADLKSNRLTRAKQKLTDLLHLRQEGQTALVVFAGSAYVVTPLTDDDQTILSQLQGLTTNIMPKQGGDIDAGLRKAIDLLAQSSVQHGSILLFTDSNRYSQDAVQQVTQAGHVIHVIGVGTPSGAPIPQDSGGFVTDSKGNIVISQLKEDLLRTLASQGGGIYNKLRVDDADINFLVNQSLSSAWQDNEKNTPVTHDIWQEEGHWLLLLVMPLLLLMFRRGMLIIALCFVLQPAPADASVLDNLWTTQDKQAEALLKQGDYQAAYEKFENPSWKAMAAYKNHDYQAATEAFKQVSKPSADDWYNQGNALAKMGKLDEAIAAYDKSLQLSSDDADAQANKTLVEQMKKQQDKEKKKQKDQDKQGQDKQGQDKQGQDKQGQDKQGQDKQGQDKQGQDKQGQDKQGQDKQGQD
ncbi:MAG: VWA domain-containing protein, partial [Ghiorsea sp.]